MEKHKFNWKHRIHLYCAIMAAPLLHPFSLFVQTTANFWQTWKEFEIRHGNEDTIREMLRIKRSVQATYNTQVNFMASQMLKVYSNATGTGNKFLLHIFLPPDYHLKLLVDYNMCLKLTIICLTIFISVSDLAPGQSGMDDMKLLEQRAEQLAAEAERDQPRTKEKILFVRWGYCKLLLA